MYTVFTTDTAGLIGIEIEESRHRTYAAAAKAARKAARRYGQSVAYIRTPDGTELAVQPGHPGHMKVVR